MPIVRRLLTDNRKFKWAMIVFSIIQVITAIALAALIFYLNRTERNGYLASLRSGTTEKILAMSDEVNSIVMPHIDLLNSLGGDLSNPAFRNTKLKELSKLPGVTEAVCLVNGNSLEMATEMASLQWLSDSLRDLRNSFYHVREVNQMIGRAKFRTYRYQQSTFYLIADTYDANGNRIVRQKGGAHRYKPNESVYLFAILVDPAWIHTEVVKHFNRIVHEKDMFSLMLSESSGLGVMSGNDTIWWYGLRTLSGKREYGVVGDWEYTSNWFQFRIVSEQSKRDTYNFQVNQLLPLDNKRLNDYFQLFVHYYGPMILKWMPYLIAALLLETSGLFLFALRQLRKQWLARQTALEQLAHSINTPVARLKLNTDTLLENRADSPEMEHDILRAIRSECDRIELAVKNASLAIDRDRIAKPNRTTVDLQALIRNLVSAWKPLFDRQKIALQFLGEGNCTGSFDKEQIELSFDNLIDNGFRHTRLNSAIIEAGKGLVTIDCRQSNDTIVVTVTDTGTGIPEKDLKRIFQRFDRSSDRALTGSTGLGIGLSLSLEIVKAHGGSISAKNIDTGGAQFTVTLPRT